MYAQNKIFSFGNKFNNLSKKVVDRIPTIEKYWNELYLV